MSATEFDIGSLIWVKGEIDQALGRAVQALGQYEANPSDRTSIKHAQTHIHQVNGAIQMVGLEGASRFTEAIEAVLLAADQGEEALDADHIGLVKKATSDLAAFLEELVNGRPNIPLKLLPTYDALIRARGEAKVAASDLFFPDLAATLPRNLPTVAVKTEDLGRFIKAQRSRYEHGLLKMLKGQAGEGLELMGVAVDAIAKIQTASLQKGFWWSVGAMIHGLKSGALALTPETKPTFARLDMQLRRLADGSGKVAERLFRDVLYLIAVANTDDERVVLVQKTFDLKALLPGGDSATAARMEPHLLRELKDHLNGAKDAWVKFTTGNTDRLPHCQEHITRFHDKVERLGLTGLNPLVEGISRVIDHLRKAPRQLSEAEAMEMATALLIFENTVTNYPDVAVELPEQVRAMVHRLDATLVQGTSGADLPEVPLLDEVSRAAQEKMLVAQVVQEIKSNLVHIEQVLDGFFREPETRSELASLEGDLNQITGAFIMMGLDKASALLQVARAQIDRYAKTDEPPEQGDLEFLAEALSTLGFYVDAVQFERPDRDQLIEPILRRIAGDVEAPVPESHPTAALLLDGEEEAPSAPLGFAELEPELQAAETPVVHPAPVEEPEPVPTAQPTTPPAAPPSAAQIASDEAVDAELLEVYLEEAEEVLATITTHVEIVRATLHDRDAMTVIRRQFHTLKGSGRMVGLNNLGEVAWEVEQVMNKWLQEERNATPALLQLIELARDGFAGWVRQLQTEGVAHVDSGPVHAMVAALKRGDEQPAEAVVDEVDAAQLAELEASGVDAAATLDAAPVVNEVSVDEPVAPVATWTEPQETAAELPALDLAPFDLPAPEPASELEALSLDEPELDLDVDVPPGDPALAELASPTQDVVPAEPEDIVVGGIAVSPVLYGIFMDEAKKYVGTLQAEAAEVHALRDEPPSSNFVHAAHTLCGITRTTGFSSIGELGYALEMWLVEQQKTDQPVPDDALPTLDETVLTLAEMIDAVERREMPAGRYQLVARIDEITEGLRTQRELSLDLDAALDEGLASGVAVDMPEPDLGAMPVAEVDELGLSLDDEAAAEVASPLDQIELDQIEAAGAEALEPELASSDVTLSAVSDEAVSAEDIDLSVEMDLAEDATVSVDADLVEETGLAEEISLGEEISLAAPELDTEPVLDLEVDVSDLSLEDASSLESVLADGETEAPAAVDDAETEIVLTVDDAADGFEIESGPDESLEDGMQLDASLDASEQQDMVLDAVDLAETELAEADLDAELSADSMALEQDLGLSVTDEGDALQGDLPAGVEYAFDQPPPSDEAAAQEASGTAFDVPSTEVDDEDVLETSPEEDEALDAAMALEADAAAEAQALADHEALAALLGEDGAELELSVATDEGPESAAEDTAEPAEELVLQLGAEEDEVAIDAAIPDDVFGIGDSEAPELDGVPEAEVSVPDVTDQISLDDTEELAVASVDDAADHPLEASIDDEGSAVSDEAAALGLAGAGLLAATGAATLTAAPFDAPPGAAPESDALAAPASVPAAPIAPTATEEAVSARIKEVQHALESAVPDDIDEQLLPIFLEEANEILPEVAAQLRAWREHPEDDGPPSSLGRSLHTLKGSARMAGAMRLGEATHNMESRVERAVSLRTFSELLFDDLDADFDRVSELVDHLINPPAAVAPVVEGGDGTAAVAAAAPVVAGRGAEGAVPTFGVSDEQSKALLRVRADLVDRLVNQAGEVSIARSRIEAEALQLKGSLLELTENVNRLRQQLREIEIQAESQMQSRMSLLQEQSDEFDPLEFDRFTRFQELTRIMAESVNDVQTVQHNLLKNIDETDAALVQQARMTKELQQELMRIRMVAFSSVNDRLYRIVRQTGKEVGKKINLEIRGGRVELDRSVLEKMIGPFEHMLRNAIDHGLESRDERLAAGKSEVGEILVEARQEGNELVLTLKDDGAGMNVPRIREKALEKGLIEPGEQISDAQVIQFVFHAGFSTASQVSQISGRGIGMDVVRSEIGELGGRIEVDTMPGKGTTFTVHLPLTLAVIQAVLVKAGTRTYAIPSVMVEQVQELKMEGLDAVYERRVVEWMGNSYPFAYLPRLLGDSETVPETKRYNTLLLIRSGQQRVAIHVDELIKNQEVVVKNIGVQLAQVIGIAGATVMGNGQVVLIINPVSLVFREGVGEDLTVRTQSAVATVQEEEKVVTTPVVMVVDDSLTVRKITGRLLQREGFQVVTAKDGVDALQQLQDFMPDVMLVDIEMPRMDGFELTRNIRSDARTRSIPIIMITSRTADKHRNYATELGVNVFLGKPYQEDELLANIRNFLQEKLPQVH